MRERSPRQAVQTFMSEDLEPGAPEVQLDLSDVSERRTLELAWGYFLRVLVKPQPAQQF